MLRTLLLAIPVIIFLLHCPASASGLPADLKSCLDSLEGQTLFLRKTFNSSRKVYCEPAGPRACFVYQQGRLFPLKQNVEVTLGGSRYFDDRNRLRLRVEQRRLGRQTIDFYWPRGTVPSLVSFRAMLGYAFAGSAEDQEFRPFIGNRSSRKLHFIGCNHLPADTLQRESFPDAEQAEQRGYEKCELCFTSFPNLRDYFLESSLGRRTAAAVRSLYTPTNSPGLKKRLTDIGNRVLDNWPTALRGYRYTFDLVGSGSPNAFACPGGRIFVTTGLYYGLESETELEGVLAHEITHVERRHGLRSYQKSISTGFWTALLEPAADLAARYSTGDRGLEILSAEAAGNLARLADKLILTGYELRQEMEADFYAISYLRSVRSDSASYSQVLRKIQYSGNLIGATGEEESGLSRDRLQEHPDIDLRTQIADNARIELYRPPVVFTGYDTEDEPVAELRLEAQVVSHGVIKGKPAKPGLSDYGSAGSAQPDRLVERLYLYVTVVSTPALGRISRLKDIRVMTAGGSVGFDNAEDTALFPDDETACTFQCDRGELLGGIEGIELKLNNVQRWRRESPQASADQPAEPE